MNTIGERKEGLSIVVIEDNQGDFVLIEDYLYEKFTTITVKHCADYKSVLAYFHEEGCKCDLIFLDLHLPDRKGIDLIHNVMELIPHVPIIILTGYGDLPLAKKSLELGVFDFLIKDEINPIVLHKSIEFAISRSSYVRHIESQNKKLRSIAWTQSHLVRSPLARMLSIINMIDILDGDYKDLPFWLEQLKSSSNEMDEILRDIVKEAQIFNLNE